MEAGESLPALRARIDGIDDRLVPLFVERMRLAEQIAALKGAAQLPVLDEGRERQVADRAADLAGVAYRDDASRLMRAVLALSRERQQRILASEGDIPP